jgi:hypothetical protein
MEGMTPGSVILLEFKRMDNRMKIKLSVTLSSPHWASDAHYRISTKSVSCAYGKSVLERVLWKI